MKFYKVCLSNDNNIMESLWGFFFCLILLLSFSASAQDSTIVDTTYFLEPVEVLSQRTVLYLDNISSSVTVLTGKKIESIGAQNLGDLLKPVTGVYVSEYGSSGNKKTVSVRGSAADQVLLLVDGKKMNPAQTGIADINQLPLENIQSVEISRSGGSVLWGTESIGGIINIRTKDGQGIGENFWIKGEYGSFSTQTLSAQIAGQKGDIDYFLSSKHKKSDGTFVFKEGFRENFRKHNNNQFKQVGLNSKLGWIFDYAHNGRVEAGFDFSQSSGGVPGTIEFPTPKAKKENDSWAANILVKGDDFLLPFNHTSKLELYQNYQKSHYKNSTENTFLAFDGNHENIATGAQFKLSANSIHFGTSYRQDKLKSHTIQGFSENNEEHQRKTFGVYSLAKFDSLWGRLNLTAGFRYDDFSDFDPMWTFESGINYPIFSRLILRMNSARAYKMPSFNDLFWTSTSFAMGNPQLQPEKSLNFDGGIIFYPVEKNRLEITYFRKNIDDLIQWNPGAGGVWRPMNVSKVVIQGLENELYIPISFANIFLMETTANYTLLKATNRTGEHTTDGKQLVRRPEHQANICFSWSYKGVFQAQYDWRYVGMRYITAANTKSLPEYHVSDVNFRLYRGKNWEFGIKVKNILDESYVDVYDFPVPGREFMTMIKIGL